MYSSFAFAMGHFSKMGFVFYLLALSVGGITGWNLARVIVILGLITIFYTLIGGLEAVIWTDVLQGFVLWTGVAVSIGLLLFSPTVHTGEVLHLIAVSHKTSLGSMSFNLHAQTFWTMAIYGLFFYLQKYTADQTVVQRYLAAKTDRAALRGIGMGAALCLPVWTAFMFIGSLLWAFYRITGEQLPATITKPDQVFPHFMVTQMPVGVAGLFLAALFGAAMSMLASDLNCLGRHHRGGFLRPLRAAQHRPATIARRQALGGRLRSCWRSRLRCASRRRRVRRCRSITWQRRSLPEVSRGCFCWRSWCAELAARLRCWRLRPIWCLPPGRP